MEYEHILILCVDRDGDIYKKVGEKGPLVGREKLLDVAMRLGLADPRESDTNALFESIKLGNELGKEGKKVRVVALVGSAKMGSETDIEISRQLDEVLKNFRADGTIVVTDGAEDEYILPIVESKTNVISIRRVIVKQSERLESTYYMLQEFLKEIANDPKLSRLLIGLPGIAAILYMLLGEHGWRLIVGVIGVFLFIKGFNLEGTVQRGYDELKSSFITGKVSILTYIISVFIALIGVVSGYDELTVVAYGTTLEGVLIFISESIDFLMFAGIVAIIGKSIDSIIEGHGFWKYAMLIIFVIAIRLIISAVSLFMLGTMGRADLALRVALGVGLSIMAILTKKAVK